MIFKNQTFILENIVVLLPVRLHLMIINYNTARQLIARTRISAVGSLGARSPGHLAGVVSTSQVLQGSDKPF